MRTKKLKSVAGMQVSSFRKTYMTFQRGTEDKVMASGKVSKGRTCGCKPTNDPKKMCGGCKISIPVGLETVIDGTAARYNLKHEFVTVISPPKVTRYKSRTPTGETVPGEVWKGSLGEFQRRFGQQFVGLCVAGWSAANETKKGE